MFTRLLLLATSKLLLHFFFRRDKMRFFKTNNRSLVAARLCGLFNKVFSAVQTELCTDGVESTVQCDYGTVQFNTVQYSAITLQYRSTQYSAVQCSTVQYSTIRCTVQRSVVQRSAMQQRPCLQVETSILIGFSVKANCCGYKVNDFAHFCRIMVIFHITLRVFAAFFYQLNLIYLKTAPI